MFMSNIAFSSEVGTGSRQEHASKQKVIRILKVSSLLAVLSVASGCSAVDRISKHG